MATSQNEFADINLSQLFEKIWKDYTYFEDISDPLNSDSVQSRLQTAISYTEKAVEMVNNLSLFTTNEHLDEVTTNEMKYMLLPAFLGYFSNKITNIERFDAVKKSQIYFIDYIRLCKLYGLTDVDVPTPYSKKDQTDSNSSAGKSSTRPSQEDLEEMTKKRQNKIARFKQQRELENSLKELYFEAKKEHVDDEIKREYYSSLLKKWLNESFDALESIDAEIPLLEHMQYMKANGMQNEIKTSCHEHKHEKLRPFIITKDQLQKKVFGLGYPSIPSFTVDEFYTQRVEQGIFPADGTPMRAKPDEAEEARQKEEAEAAKEKLEEEDDQDAIEKARQWDEYTDDHRRGWGNTHNKG